MKTNEHRVSIIGRVEPNQLVWHTYDPIIVFVEYRIYKGDKVVFKETGTWHDLSKLKSEIKRKLEEIINS